MSRSVRIAVAAALLLGETSLATAKTRGAPRTAIVSHPGINETRLGPTVADPTIACLIGTMVIPIRSKAYSTSMLCHLSVPVTLTIT